ncbi:Hypothetical predicted protein [Lecanosticta acicola]|uniref:Uncharacterized protein n=1 Tax=Lecanosticta acicola TaxID=111012 RepID=A0AAI8YXV7_9PEZI|nr:Hypothetical predicted protein [Lecanosticta acicola]
MFIALWYAAVAGAVQGASAQFDEGHLQKPLKADDRPFNWHNIEPSTHLQYVPCYNGLQCARLHVPLNWNASKEEQLQKRAAIAIARLPAKVSVNHPDYGGAILINPEGPGESGVDHVISRGRAIQTIVDASSDPPVADLEDNHPSKFFDILGFDPRGVKYTTPSLDCFSDAFSQQTWLLTRMDYGAMFETNPSLAMEWARTEVLGRSCSLEDEGGILRYLNTPQVVKDMFAFIEAHGEWRETKVEDMVISGKES